MAKAVSRLSFPSNNLLRRVDCTRIAAALKFVHFTAAADDERGPLMNTSRFDRDDAPDTIDGGATSLFRNKREGIGFIEQA